MAEIAQTQVLTIIAPALQHFWVEIVIILITVSDTLATDTEFAIQLKPGLIVYAMMVLLERSAMNWTFVLSSRAVVMGFVNAMDPITFASAIEDIMEKIAILLITVIRILANLANVVKVAQDICVTVMRDSKGFTVMKLIFVTIRHVQTKARVTMINSITFADALKDTMEQFVN